MKHNQAFLWKLCYIIIIIIIIIIIVIIIFYTTSSSSWSLVSDLEFGNVGFWGEGKTRVPRKKILPA